MTAQPTMLEAQFEALAALRDLGWPRLSPRCDAYPQGGNDWLIVLYTDAGDVHVVFKLAGADLAEVEREFLCGLLESPQILH